MPFKAHFKLDIELNLYDAPQGTSWRPTCLSPTFTSSFSSAPVLSRLTRLDPLQTIHLHLVRYIAVFPRTPWKIQPKCNRCESNKWACQMIDEWFRNEERDGGIWQVLSFTDCLSPEKEALKARLTLSDLTVTWCRKSCWAPIRSWYEMSNDFLVASISVFDSCLCSQ